jgi:hypothetical protein
MADSQHGADDDDVTQVFPGQDAVIVTRRDDPPGPEPHPGTEVVTPQATTEIAPPHPPTEVAAHHPPTQVVPQHPPTVAASTDPAAPAYQPTVTAGPGPAVPAGPPAPFPPTAGTMPPSPVAGIVKYGPGVPVVLPVSQGGRTAEQVWRGSQPAAAPLRSVRLRRWGGSALTVILLAASGVVLFLRFYHPPFRVTGVAITQQALAGCRVDVTGQVSTNGAAGTVTYRWLFEPGQQQATTLSQSVSSGQHAVDVTVTVAGSGQGSASQTAILQVLSPDRQTESTHVALSC